MQTRNAILKGILWLLKALLKLCLLILWGCLSIAEILLQQINETLKKIIKTNH
jgi:hypothetical protein